MNTPLSLIDRTYLAMTRLVMLLEEHGVILDSDVLDAIEMEMTGACDWDVPCGRDGHNCCDYQQLSALVWYQVESGGVSA